MLKNYFKIAARSLFRNKAFTAINIFGLAAGIATCLVIVLFIQDELSYDKYNEKADQIVRITFHGKMKGQNINESTVMPPVAQASKAEFPEVKEATRIRRVGSPIMSYGEKSFKEDGFAYVDSNFFQVFTLPLIEGDAKTALLEPNNIIITTDIAKKYFGDSDPLGKTLAVKSSNSLFKVAGVIKPVPANSHFKFDFFASMSGFDGSRSTSWMESEFYTYFVLPIGYNYKNLEAKLPQLVDKYMSDQLQQAFGMSLQQFRNTGNDVGFSLQRLTDIHLHSNFAFDLKPAGDIRYLYLFGAIAIFMLLIACINFMNLSTAGASKRAKEVGIRKVMGSLKPQLIRQFLVESILISSLSLLVAIVLVYAFLPYFNEISGKQLGFQFSQTLWLIPALIGIGLVTGILAGSYPAFYLSSFKPVAVLKGRFSNSRQNSFFRNGLVVFQFFISISLIVGTTIVYKQLEFIQTKKLGYDKSQVMVLPEMWLLGDRQEVFKQKLLQDSRVLSVSTSGYVPAGDSYNNNFFVSPGGESSEMIKTLRYDVDYDYISTLGMELVAGRNFSRTFGTDSSAVILNETAAKTFGWESNAIGKVLTNRDNDGTVKMLNVVGVIKDFHFKSLHEKISPLVMVLGQGASTMIIKTKTGDVSGLISYMDKEWKSLKAEAPMAYSFLDDRFNNTYMAEQKTAKLLGVFALLTILVACLGLFGLSTFTAEQRVKEIGIRKVLGATESGIVALLTKDFLKLVAISFVIAVPFAWWMMSKWLQDFAYRIDISIWVFVMAAGVAILITLITVSFKAIKAAVANPVRSLRAE